MKYITVLMLGVFLLVTSAIADIKVVSVKGNIQVRRGISEQWNTLAAGDILKPEDSMRSGKKSSAVVLISGKKKITIPEMIIIDCSDLRELTQEELLLMLAMESVRSVPVKEGSDALTIPKTTSVHGDDRDVVGSAGNGNSETGILQLNGTKVLYDQGFYATCVLKAKEVFRINPGLRSMINYRLTVATAMEKMKLTGEALSEYNSLKSERLNQEQKELIKLKISQLRKKGNG